MERIVARASSFSGPGSDYVPVVPSDVADFPDQVVALYVEGGGVVCFVTARGETRTVAVPDFGWILCLVSAVRASGTTASGIHAVVVG